MSVKSAIKSFGLGVVGTVMLLPALAHAERIDFKFGASSGAAKQSLTELGYNQIQIIHQGFKTVRAHACQGATRYEVKLSARGDVRARNQIGTCQTVVSRQFVEKKLTQLGFSRVALNEQNGYYVAVGCDPQNQRMRVIINQYGQVERKRAFGQCEQIFEPTDITPVLRKAGYNRIKFIDRQLPWYLAEACKQNKRMELLLTRYGEVRRERHIGQCKDVLAPGNIEAHLKQKGYSNIYVYDKKLPRYLAEACQNGRLYEVALNRFGDVNQRKPLGQCAPLVTVKDVRASLKQQGFVRIRAKKKLVRDQYAIGVIACLKQRRHLITFSQYGDVTDYAEDGLCKARSVRQIRDQLTKLGVKQTRFFVMGCLNGQHIRYQLNAIGDVIGEKRVGKCDV